jgi:hypothetical protein
MKTKWINILWGIVLVAAGGLFLARNLGYLGEFEAPVWAVIFAGASLLFFITYFINGIRNWGWLFPACIFAALAVIIYLTETAGWEGSGIAVLVLVAVAIPFFVAFLLAPRQNWWALIPAWVMVAVSVIIVATEDVQGEWIGALVLFSIALPFLVVYLFNRKNWWALIPAWTLMVVGVIVLMSATLIGELIGAMVVFAIGLPFLVIFLVNRQNWWALIPAWTLLVVGLIILLSNKVAGEWVAVVVLMGIALPFFVVYFCSVENWWALIPAGVLTSAAAPVFLVGLLNKSGVEIQPGLINGITFLGIALTFFVLWLRRSVQPTEWAIYAAGIALAVAIVSFLFSGSDIAGPVIIIAVGMVILYYALRRKKA